MKYYFEYVVPNKMHGPAITAVQMDEDGTMWVTNEEHMSQVNYCPFTGTPAQKKMIVIKYHDNGAKTYDNE